MLPFILACVGAGLIISHLTEKKTGDKAQKLPEAEIVEKPAEKVEPVEPESEGIDSNGNVEQPLGP